MLVKMIAAYTLIEFEDMINEWFAKHSGITLIGVNYETTVETSGDILFSCMIVYTKSV